MKRLTTLFFLSFSANAAIFPSFSGKITLNNVGRDAAVKLVYKCESALGKCGEKTFSSQIKSDGSYSFERFRYKNSGLPRIKSRFDLFVIVNANGKNEVRRLASGNKPAQIFSNQNHSIFYIENQRITFNYSNESIKPVDPLYALTIRSNSSSEPLYLDTVLTPGVEARIGGIYTVKGTTRLSGNVEWRLQVKSSRPAGYNISNQVDEPIFYEKKEILPFSSKLPKSMSDIALDTNQWKNTIEGKWKFTYGFDNTYAFFDSKSLDNTLILECYGNTLKGEIISANGQAREIESGTCGDSIITFNTVAFNLKTKEMIPVRVTYESHDQKVGHFRTRFFRVAKLSNRENMGGNELFRLKE